MKKNRLASIFGVKILPLSKREVQEKIEQALASKRKIAIANLNPEILLKANSDNDFAELLNWMDIKIIDGIGVKLVAWLKGMKVGERISGADLALWLANEAKRKDLRLRLVMNRDGLSTRGQLENFIKENNFKNFSITEINLGQVNFEIENQDQAEIMLVGLGAPHQERFIKQVVAKNDGPFIAMGVGGTLDYWTGQQIRAPLFFRKIGLEWLWRLVMQPRRLQRVFSAVFVFPYKFITHKNG